MKKNKIAILYFIASISFLVSATIYFFGSSNGLGAIQLILGTTFLYIALENSKIKRIISTIKKGKSN